MSNLNLRGRLTYCGSIKTKSRLPLDSLSDASLDPFFFLNNIFYYWLSGRSLENCRSKKVKGCPQKYNFDRVFSLQTTDGVMMIKIKDYRWKWPKLYARNYYFISGSASASTLLFVFCNAKTMEMKQHNHKKVKYLNRNKLLYLISNSRRICSIHCIKKLSKLKFVTFFS